MKKLLLLLMLVLPMLAQAQDVDINKETNMVQVNGKDAFYLTPKNKQFLECDYSLENLSHQELAYLKLTKYGSSICYNMVFTHSGNQCLLTGFNSFGILKHLAKVVAGANLVQNNVVSNEEERKFVTLNGGTYMAPAPPPSTAPVADRSAERKNFAPAEIGIKGNKIYNNSEVAGIFKTQTVDGVTTISVYNNNDVMVCKASHKDNNDNADWDVLIDGKAVTVLYNPGAPLEKLFKYLAEKGLL